MLGIKEDDAVKFTPEPVIFDREAVPSRLPFSGNHNQDCKKPPEPPDPWPVVPDPVPVKEQPEKPNT